MPKIIIKNLVAFTKDNKSGTINLAFEGLKDYRITKVEFDNMKPQKQVFITVEKIGIK